MAGVGAVELRRSRFTRYTAELQRAPAEIHLCFFLHGVCIPSEGLPPMHSRRFAPYKDHQEHTAPSSASRRFAVPRPIGEALSGSLVKKITNAACPSETPAIAYSGLRGFTS